MEKPSAIFRHFLEDQLLECENDAIIWHPVYAKSVTKVLCKVFGGSDSGKLQGLVRHCDCFVVTECLAYLTSNVKNVDSAIVETFLRRMSIETDADVLKALFDVCTKSFSAHKNVFLSDASKTTSEVVDKLKTFDASSNLLPSALRFTALLLSQMEKV